MPHPNQIFDTVSRRDPLELWPNDSDAPDYQRVTELVDLSRSDVSKVAGVAKQSVRYDNRIPEAVRKRLDEIANICTLVGEFFDGDAHKTALWFRTANPMFGNISPRDMIRFGRYKKLLNYILEARQQNRGGEQKKNETATATSSEGV